MFKVHRPPSDCMNCISLLTSQEHFNVQDIDETKTSVDNALTKFMDLARQTEAFFLKKRMVTSYQKPKQQLDDDMAELRYELNRKEQLLEKNLEKLRRCQLMLQSGGTGAAPSGASAAPSVPPQPQTSTPQPMPPQAMGGPQYPPQGSIQMPQTQPGMTAPFPPQAPGYPHPPPQHTPPMQPHPMQMPPRPQQPPPSYPQGPLAYLEQTMSNIGMPDRR